MKKCLLLILAAALYFVSCKKKGDEGPQGPAGSSYKGTIKGFISVYDQFGSQTYSNLQNIKVVLQGSRSAVTITNSSGLFKFDSVPSGNYSIAVSGDGLAPKVVNNVSFMKDTLFEEISVSQLPTFQIAGIFSMASPWSDYLHFGIYLTGARQATIALFIGTDPQVSNINYKLDTVVATRTDSIVAVYMWVSKLETAGMFSGDTIYIAAYPYSTNNYSLYQDVNTGRTVYTAVGTPMRDTIKIP